MKRIIAKIIETNKISLDKIFLEGGKIYTPLNPVSYLNARKNQDIFRRLDGIWADGYILTLFIWLFYRSKIERKTFDMTSLAPPLFEFASLNKKQIYFVGSETKDVTKAVQIIRENYPNLQIIGYRNGYFNSDSDMTKEFDNILAINPDFVIVGMGIVAQESFLCKLKDRGFKGIGVTCGGFIHQTAKDQTKVDYYPYWIDKYNLRFLYRMYREKHTRKRYAYAAFVFPVLFIYDKIKGK